MSDHDLDLPFEEVPGGPIRMPLRDDAVVCGGLVIRAGFLETDRGNVPSLTFDFFQLDGSQLFPIVFATDDPEQLRNLASLVTASVSAAIDAVHR